MSGEMQSEPNETAAGNHVKSQRKRKNVNRKFLKNVRGFAKKGNYGRGTEIQSDQFTYFVKILDEMKAGFETTEDKVTMVDNVFEQTIDQEIHLSSNQVVSKVIESIVGFTSAENFERLQRVFGENLRPICSNNYASHVLQKMVEIAFLRAVGQNSTETEIEEGPSAKKSKESCLSEREYNLTTEFPKEHRETCSAFVLKIGKFLLNNLEDFLFDPYANHIMRTSITCLGGIHSSKVAFERPKSRKLGDCYEVPEEWNNVVLEYANRLQQWPQFPDLPYSELSSVLIGRLCTTLKRIDKNSLKKFGYKILHKGFLEANEDDDKKNDEETQQNNEEDEVPKVPKVFQSEASIRLLEELLTVAGRKLFTQLYAMLFAGRVKILALDKTTNFSVQKLIDNIEEKDDFEKILTEVEDHIEEILKVGHTGVVYSLSSACLRLATKQRSFVIALQNALHTSGSKDKQAQFYNCLLKLKPLEIAAEDKSQFIHLHGSLIIQNILQFNKPIFLVNFILETPPHELAATFSTPNGSYIADTFLTSKFIGEKSREKFIRHLEGNYIDMAGTKFGSRVVENIFEAASDGQKFKIAKELADKKNQLNGTSFGRLLFKKFRLETFCLSPIQWKAAFDKANKAEKLFKDILAK